MFVCVRVHAYVRGWHGWMCVCVRVCLRVCVSALFSCLTLRISSSTVRRRSLSTPPATVTATTYTFVAWRQQKRKASWTRLALKLYDARITARVRVGCPGFTRGSEHDPDVRCGVCAEWWVPLLKESTCSFHLFACVFLTSELRGHPSQATTGTRRWSKSRHPKRHMSACFIQFFRGMVLTCYETKALAVCHGFSTTRCWIWTAHREARGTGYKWLQEDEQRHFRRIWPCVP